VTFSVVVLLLVICLVFTALGVWVVKALFPGEEPPEEAHGRPREQPVATEVEPSG